MTSFKRYFISHARSDFRPFIYILVTVLAMTLLIGIDAQPISRFDHVTEEFVDDYQSTLFLPVTFMCILAYVLPVMEFAFFKKRINLDCAYSLPISRRAMGLVHYLTGLMMLLIVFSASYLINFLLLLARGPGWFNFLPLIGHYFLCLVLGFAIYSVLVFVFNEANTMGDGIWFMLLYTFVFILCFGALCEITDNTGAEIAEGVYGAIPWGTVDMLTTSYQYLVEINFAHKAMFWSTTGYVMWFIFWIAAGIASALGFFFTFGKRRMEKTEEISDSFFGFRVLIPIYAFCGMILFNGSDEFVFWLIIQVLTILGYTIYRRGFHYKKDDIAVLCILAFFLFV